MRRATPANAPTATDPPLPRDWQIFAISLVAKRARKIMLNETERWDKVEISNYI